MKSAGDIRLLAVSHNLNLEGAAISMFELMVGLAENTNFYPSIISLSDGPLRDQYLKNGLEVIDLPCNENWLRDRAMMHEVIESLAVLIERNNFDLIYANTLLGYPVIHASDYVNKPSVWNIRESQSEEFWHDYLGARYSMMSDAFCKTDSVVFVAEATRDLWKERLKLQKSYLIHNALKIDSFRSRRTEVTRDEWRKRNNIDSNAIVFLCVGTLHERKGQLDLLEAVLQLQDSETKPVAVCVGDAGGAYSKQLHGLWESLSSDLNERIKLLPREFNIADAYAAADVFVCCSRNESYPRIILEALASGLPIVTTPVNGISEQVECGVNALCYQPGDIENLKTSLARLLDSTELRIAYSQAAKKRFSEMPTFLQMVSSYEQVFRNTLQLCDDL